MPWLSEAMKDVISCDKLRGSANRKWSAGFRMGQPITMKSWYSQQWECKPGELKHLSTRRKRKQFSDSVSSGERKRNSPNHRNHGFCGVVGLHLETNLKQKFLESYTKEGESPVRRNDWGRAVSWVPRGRRRPVGIYQHHLVRLNTTKRPIVNKYRKGKVKRTVNNGVK